MSRHHHPSGDFSMDADAFGGQAVSMGRSDVRPLVLAALIDSPAHGYELIRRLEKRTDGTWRPSAGSVYPTLQQFEEVGF